MSLTATAALTAAAAPIVTADERATRLIDAGTTWTERVTASPASAQLTYKVGGQGEGAVASRISAGTHEFFVDEPAGLAGDDIAASPVEIALGALISCQIVVYRLYAQNLGIEIDSITAQAEGDLDVHGLFGLNDSVRPGFSDVRLTINVTGPESDDRYEELHRVVDAHCPVLDLFANATPVSVTLVAN
ncbi:OsmC family protein [Salinibacterium sp. ZJ450]|uniref:OsmC family protein n=1 Tax=Salinibacterium sp. ZJ450 TaxID=2708338 RepID=UPI00141F8353|nr:OsmC family protein [Salinibacterium sp. ZJ450]